jgi:hypothetical protein
VAIGVCHADKVFGMVYRESLADKRGGGTFALPFPQGA